MSSFIVENKTINRFLTWLYWLKSDNIFKYRVYKCFSKYKIDGKNKEKVINKGFNRLGMDMLKLNYEAVNYRYDEKKEAKSFEFKDEKVRDVQVLKSLQCFIYQCSEGNTPKRKLYRDLRDVESCLKSIIIYKCTDYDKLDWG